jgi:hypothetical protein
MKIGIAALTPLLALSCSAVSGAQSQTHGNPRGAARAEPRAAIRAPLVGGVDDPVAWVRQAYDPASRQETGSSESATAGDGGYSSTPEFSPRLRALFAEDESYANGEVGRLDFNPFSGAQDDDIKRADVTSSDVDGAPDRKVVIAKFRNMDVNQTITFYWERIAGRWYIDDISGRTAGDSHGWTLSLILKFGSHGP